MVSTYHSPVKNYVYVNFTTSDKKHFQILLCCFKVTTYNDMGNVIKLLINTEHRMRFATPFICYIFLSGIFQEMFAGQHQLPCESRLVRGGGGGCCVGSAGMGGNGRSMLAPEVSGAGGGTDGGPAPGSGIGRSSGEVATELPDTELREVVFVIPGRQTDWKRDCRLG